MADLGFGKDPAETMQGGTGDPEYIGFIHGFMKVITVSLSELNFFRTYGFLVFDRLLLDLGFYVSSELLSVLPSPISFAGSFQLSNIYISSR